MPVLVIVNRCETCESRRVLTSGIIERVLMFWEITIVIVIASKVTLEDSLKPS